MSAADPTPRLPAARRRRQLLDVALAAFSEGGFHGTSMDDVAAAAGVTKPVLYRHFDDKQALYLALLQRHRDDLSSFAAAIPPGGTAQERLRAVLEVWLAYVEDHPYAWKMLFRDTGGGPEVEAFRLDVHARARAVLARMIDALSEAPIPQRELEPLAELMSMGMASLVLWWMDEPDIPREALLDAMTRVWTGLLGAAG